MIKIDVKLDVAKLKKEFSDKQITVRKVAARAINRAADAGATTAGRTISAATKIKVRDVRRHISVSGANPDRLYADIDAHPYSPNLDQFKPTQNAKGVAATAWEGRKTYNHAFRLPSGKVVTRTGSARKPLKGLRGPSVPRTFMRTAVLAAIEESARARFASEFEREATRRLRT